MEATLAGLGSSGRPLAALAVRCTQGANRTVAVIWEERLALQLIAGGHGKGRWEGRTVRGSQEEAGLARAVSGVAGLCAVPLLCSANVLGVLRVKQKCDAQKDTARTTARVVRAVEPEPSWPWLRAGRLGRVRAGRSRDGRGVSDHVPSDALGEAQTRLVPPGWRGKSSQHHSPACFPAARCPCHACPSLPRTGLRRDAFCVLLRPLPRRLLGPSGAPLACGALLLPVRTFAPRPRTS